MDLIVLEFFGCAFLEIMKQQIFQINVRFLSKENMCFILAYLCLFLIMLLNRNERKKEYNCLFATIIVFLSFFAIMSSKIESPQIAIVYMCVLMCCGILILSLIFFLTNRLEVQNNKINMLSEINQKYMVEEHNYAQIKRLSAYLSERNENNDFQNSFSNNVIRFDYCEKVDDLIECYKIIFADMNVKFNYFTEKISLKYGNKLFFVISNLLDNAKDACLKNTSKSEVVFYMYHKADLLVIVVKNTIEDSVLKRNPLLLSDKLEENHGLGLKYVKKVIEEYGGVVNISERDGMFQVRVAVDAW